MDIYARAKLYAKSTNISFHSQAFFSISFHDASLLMYPFHAGANPMFSGDLDSTLRNADEAVTILMGRVFLVKVGPLDLVKISPKH